MILNNGQAMLLDFNGHRLRDAALLMEPKGLLGPLAAFSNPPPREMTFAKVAEELLNYSATSGILNANNLEVGIEICKAKATEIRINFPDKCRLNKDLAATLLAYTMQLGNESVYEVINRSLRDQDRNALWPFRNFIWMLMHALNGCECYNGRLVYRGVKRNMSQLFVCGEVVVWHQFSSCTCNLEQEESELFCGKSGDRTVFIIELTTTRAREVSQYTFYPNEQEVILPPNSRFLVVSKVDLGNGLIQIHLKELPPLDPILVFDTERVAGFTRAARSSTPSATTPGHRNLKDLTVDQVLVVMRHLGLEELAQQVRAKTITGRRLAAVTNVEDLGYLGLTVNPLEDRMLFDAIDEYKDRGVPPDVLEAPPSSGVNPGQEESKVTMYWNLLCSMSLPNFPSFYSGYFLEYTGLEFISMLLVLC